MWQINRNFNTLMKSFLKMNTTHLEIISFDYVDMDLKSMLKLFYSCPSLKQLYINKSNIRDGNIKINQNCRFDLKSITFNDCVLMFDVLKFARILAQNHSLKNNARIEDSGS